MRNIFASSLLAIALVATPTAARTTTEVEVRVSYSDLDLNNTADAAVFERRLSQKIRAACTYDRQLKAGKQLDRKCYADAKRAVKASLAQQGTQLAAVSAAK